MATTVATMTGAGRMHWVCRFVFCLEVSTCLLVSGCSGGGSAAPATAALTCQDLRVRVRANCTSEVDKACVDGLVAMATPAAQMAFRTLAACTLPFCAAGDFYCSCEQRCFGDGHCLPETEACAAGGSDVVCDELCH